jgi:hypothetical protein
MKRLCLAIFALCAVLTFTACSKTVSGGETPATVTTDGSSVIVQDTSAPTSDTTAEDGTLQTPQSLIDAYLNEKFTAAYTPYYDNLKFEIVNYNEVADYSENPTAGKFTATFDYLSEWTNYYQDPETVQWIIDAKENGDSAYQTYIDEYNAVQKGSFGSFQVTGTITAEGGLDMGTIEVLCDSSVQGPPVYDVPVEDVFPANKAND